MASGIEAQLEMRKQRLAQGDSSLGWKLAFSAPPALEELGIDGPLVGFLTSGTELSDGAEVPLSGWSKAALEPELAILLGTDLDAGASREEASAAIAGLGMAIELADVDIPRTEVERVVAGDIYHRHVIVGRSDLQRAGADVAGIVATVSRNGSVEASTDDPEAAVGDLVDLTRHVANFAAAIGCSLKAGEVIISGAIVPLVWVAPGDRFVYESALGKLDVSFSA